MPSTRNPAAFAAACLVAAQLLAAPLAFAQTSPTWTGADIGAVAAAGSNSVSGNSFTERASGADIWNTADEFRFVYRTLTGDGEITAQVASVTNTHEWTKAGVMVRESLAANSRFALMCVTPGKGAAFHYRTMTGGNAAPSNSGDLTTTAPYWVRVTRQGATVSGYLSADGVSWTLRNTVTLSNLASTVYVGLALTSHLDGTLATAVFNNPVIVTPGTTTDTTAPSVPQNVRATAGSPTSVTITWNASTDTGGSGLAGYRIFRNGSSTALATVSATSYTDTAVAANTSYTYTVAARDNAGNQSLPSSAASVTTPASVTWTGTNIGAVAAQGSHTINGSSFTVRGSGADIWNTADEFYYVYRTLAGDGEIAAQVSSITNTNQWTKAGVMLRESLAANSRFALMCVTPGKGAAFHYRTTTGGSAAPANSGDGTTKAPYWVRVKREGTIVRGYISPDGVNWTLRNSVTLSSLASTVYVGLALTSHADGTLATAVFNNPAVVTGPGTTPDTTAPSVPQSVRATAVSSTSISVAWNASTDSGGSGLAGYRVFRNGSTTPIATVTATSYTDTNLSPNTSYSYTVRAFDGASNQSAASNAASATTPATPPPPVSGLDTRPVNNTCLAWDRPTAGSTIALTRYTNLSFNSSVAMVQPPNASTHWYVVEQGGIVKRFAIANPTTTTEVVNLTSRITSGGEMGLLGMAFHPSFPTDKRVFLSYTVRVGSQLVSRISSFLSNDNGVTLAPGSETILLTLNQPEDNHNGGNIVFGPDGYLYIGFGDGGGAGDVHGTNGSGQRLTTMLGKLLRIDVNGAAPYAVPSSNPFFNSANPGDRCPAAGRSSGNCPEIYAYGFRNPWRWSFDRSSGQLWVADVGQGDWEEVDQVQRGGNYGWRCREGAHTYNTSGTPACSGATLIDPVAEYDHSIGASITGGYVYRGSQNTTLKGRFIFGDFVSGRIFAWIAENATQPRQPTQLLASGLSIASFAQGNDGELYVVDYGSLYRITFQSGGGGTQIPATLSATGCANPSDTKQPSSGLVPYGVSAQFWSDGASKDRWIGLPNGTSIVVQADRDWDFPAGTVLRKDFRLGTQLVETRLLMRHPDGNWGGFTYEWNAAQTDATLLQGGATRTVNGQQWIFPSEGQCLECHTAAAGRTLGPQTAQLNRNFTYPQTGRSANQLFTLNHIGVLSPPITDPSAQPTIPDPADTSAPLANRARAWLDTNCSQCHRPGGPTPSTMDLRYTTPLNATNACNAQPQSGDLGLGVNARLIAPGSAANSIVVNRANRRDSNAMPPLGSTRVDSAGVALLTSWINSLTGC
ncbi:MAG TPA: PQQ-dependent sugar dehydrogenase [Steroidobacteraceae bacterium]